MKLGKPDLPVLMFSAYYDPTYVARAVALGASGYLLKNCSRDELLSAIRKAAVGENIFTRLEFRSHGRGPGHSPAGRRRGSPFDQT